MTGPGHTWRGTLTECPWCGKANDSHTRTAGSGSDEPPAAGAVTVCVACGGIAIFASDSQLRRPSAEEFDELSAHPDVRDAVRIVGLIQQRRAAAKN